MRNGREKKNQIKNKKIQLSFFRVYISGMPPQDKRNAVKPAHNS